MSKGNHSNQYCAKDKTKIISELSLEGASLADKIQNKFKRFHFCCAMDNSGECYIICNHVRRFVCVQLLNA